MTMTIIETHAHLDFKEFDRDRSEVLRRARRAGVGTFINISLHPDEADKTFALVSAHDDIFAAVGIHPHKSGEYSGRLQQAITELRRLAQHPRVVALGEMGLDYYRDYAPRSSQQAVFKAQLELACELGLPVVIHSRQADEQVLEFLEQSPPQRVVMHCFSGDDAIAQRCADAGYYIGIGGVLTYPKAERLRSIVKSYPRDLVVLETDCPFLAPQPKRGKRNEPSYLSWVVEALSRLWGLANEEVASITTANARRLFGLPINGGSPS